MDQLLGENSFTIQKLKSGVTRSAYGIARAVIRWNSGEHRWHWLRCSVNSAVSFWKQRTLHGTRNGPVMDENTSGEILGTFLQIDLKAPTPPPSSK